MSNSVYLLGGGGHGRVVLDALNSAGFQVRGVIDPALQCDVTIAGIPVLGGDKLLDELNPTESFLALGVGANPLTDRRAAIFLDAKARGWSFVSVAHTSAILADGCEIGEGCQRMAGSVVQPRTRIGVNTVINTRASIDHDCEVSDHAFISPGVTICGDVFVGVGAFVGAGAVIMPGVTLGEHVVVGAGAVVLGNVAAGETVVGNPARARKKSTHV